MRAHHPISRLAFALVLLATLGGGAAFTPASALAKLEDCVIPKEKPLKIVVRAGEGKAVRCYDGRLSIVDIPVDMENTPGGEEAIVPASDNGAATDTTGDIVAAAYGEATCHVRTRAYESADVRITESDLKTAWQWDGTRILGLGKVSQYMWWRSSTGWSKVQNAQYLYQKTYSNGYWSKQGFEGWAEYQWYNGAYNHTHHKVSWVSRDGGCWGENYSWGTLPGAGSEWQYTTFTTAYVAS